MFLVACWQDFLIVALLVFQNNKKKVVYIKHAFLKILPKWQRDGRALDGGDVGDSFKIHLQHVSCF